MRFGPTRLRFVVWVPATALLLCATAAGAEPPKPPGLNWVRLEGAQACISAAALAARVESRVGRVLFAPIQEAGVFVDGYVGVQDAGGFHVRLEISDPSGSVLGRRDMTFAGKDCSVIDDAVALVIAVTLYPNTGLLDAGIPLEAGTAATLASLFGQEPTDPDPASLPTRAAPPASTTAASSTRARSRANATINSHGAGPATNAEPWAFGLDAVATGGFGQLPGMAAGIAGHVLLTPPTAWPIEAGLVVFPPARTDAQRASGRVDFDLLVGTLAVCPWQPSWLSGLALCVGAEVGRLQAQASGFASRNQSSSDTVASVLGSALLRTPLGASVYLRSALIIAVPIDQRRYSFETDNGGSETLFRIPQLTARAELGLGLRF
jgi:hypothetical protein